MLNSDSTSNPTKEIQAPLSPPKIEGTGFDFWIDLLSFVRPLKANRVLLNEYLLKEFSANVERFSHLLVSINNYLSTVPINSSTPTLAENYLKVLSPLAERFGIFKIKNSLDTTCFKILHPEGFIEVEEIVSGYKGKSDSYLLEVQSVLKSLLTEHSYDFEIRGRYKSPYSIYMKLYKNGRRELVLHDIFAVRIVLNSSSIEECFNVLNILHDEFYPVTDKFKDYISIPKINGYESIHTCLTKIIDSVDIPVEVQIRTRKMHDYAENGLASHWIYSSNKQTSEGLSSAQERLLEVFRAYSKGVESENKIYFLSFEGDLYVVKKGATVLDFAYGLHTHLGNRATGALVNGVMQSLEYKIQEGDRVEITTATTKTVKPEWADFVLHSSTKKKIHANWR